MFWRVVWGSLRHQRGRLGVATLAVVLGAGLVSALVNLSFDVNGQAGRELRAYGANMLMLPDGAMLPAAAAVRGPVAEERGIPESGLSALDSVEEVIGYAPFLYLVAEIGDQPVVVAGTRFGRARAVSPWWRVEGRWPRSPGEGLIGVGVARALGLAANERIVLEYGARTQELTVSGVVETGGSEDSQILVDLSLAQSLGGRPGEVGLVQVSALAGGRSLDEVASSIEARLPEVEVRPLQRFTRAEKHVLDRIRRLMALVAVLVLAVAALTVGSSMVTAVVQRRAEIGLMKSLGAGWQVAAFFLTEGLSMAIVGGLAGYAGGLAMAALIGRQVFQADLSPAPAGLAITLAVAVGVVVLASLWPVRRALAVNPAVTLRGE